MRKEKLLHRPGIEPGPPAWQASILPLNQRCSDVTQSIIVQSVWASLNVSCLINVSGTAWMPQMWKMKRQSTQFECHKCGKGKKTFLQLAVFEPALPEKKLKLCFENIQVLPRFELGSQDSES